jgi:hypothetical protein
MRREMLRIVPRPEAVVKHLAERRQRPDNATRSAHELPMKAHT